MPRCDVKRCQMGRSAVGGRGGFVLGTPCDSLPVTGRKRLDFVVRATRLPSDRLALGIGVGQQQASGTAQRLPLAPSRPIDCLGGSDAQEW